MTQVRRHHRVVDRDHEVERIRRARAHQVAQLLVDHALARALLQQLRRRAGRCRRASGARRRRPRRTSTISPPTQRGALGDRHHRVVARVRALVRPAAARRAGRRRTGTSLMIARSTPERYADTSEVSPAVAAEDLDDREALVRAGARAQLVDEVHGPRDRGREPDAVVGAVDVVVHRLRDGDDGDALLVQPQRERERVVAADRDRARRSPGGRGRASDVRRVVAGLVVGAAAPTGTPARRPAGPSPGSSVTCAGTCRPERSIVRTAAGSSDTTFAATLTGSSGSTCSRPPHPRRMPTISWPADAAARSTTALMLAFRPGTSPPPVRIPMLHGCSLRAGVHRARANRFHADHEQSTSGIRQSASGTTREPAATSTIGVVRVPIPSVPTMDPHRPAIASSTAARAEPGGEHAVDGAGRAAPLHVAQHRDPGLVARPPADLFGRRATRSRPDAGTRSRRAGSAGIVIVPSVAIAPSDTTTIEKCRRTAWTSATRRQTSSMSNGCSGSRITSAPVATPAVHPIHPAWRPMTSHDHDAVVALGRAVEAVDQIGRDLGRGREADARVGAADVVVDRLRDPDRRDVRASTVSPIVPSPPIDDEAVETVDGERVTDPLGATVDPVGLEPARRRGSCRPRGRMPRMSSIVSSSASPSTTPFQPSRKPTKLSPRSPSP